MDTSQTVARFEERGNFLKINKVHWYLQEILAFIYKLRKLGIRNFFRVFDFSLKVLYL